MGLLPLRLPAPALIAGWVIGSFTGLGLCWMDGLKPVHPIAFAGFSASVSTGLLGLAVNIVVTLALGSVIRLVLAHRRLPCGSALACGDSKDGRPDPHAAPAACGRVPSGRYRRMAGLKPAR
ncbi:hypothetical protein RAA17_21350 [Komagataeibacter rhaeticus]|nr:hypothetical protein [Komagataeibacter rhaeticus]